VSFLIIGIALWNTMMVNKAFCKPIDGTIGKKKKHMQESEICIYDKCQLHQEQTVPPP
jgi:hypothetical protein